MEGRAERGANQRASASPFFAGLDVDFTAFGDSKSNATYQAALISQFASAGLTAVERPASLATNGATVQSRLSTLAADLNARGDTPKYILCNLGINDIGTNQFNDSAARDLWVTRYQSCIDQMHAKWPNARIGIMRIWGRAYPFLDLMDDTYIPQVIANRDWASLGPDERIFLENGDDGVTYTTDGVHSTAAGYALGASLWKAWMGY